MNMGFLKRFIAIFTVLALATGMLSACANNTESASSDTSNGTTSADAVADDSVSGDSANAPLVFAITGFDTKNFMPTSAMPLLLKYVLQAVYETLLETGEDGTLQPALAESYEVAADYLSVTFHLRTGVTFHDGSPLTADDVIYSFDEYLKPESTNGKTLQTYVVNVEKTDDYTIVVYCKSAYPFILNTLAEIYIIPKAYVEEQGVDNFNARPIGTGAYRIAALSQDVSVTLKAVPNHWRDDPEYKTVTVLNVPDASTQLAMLKTGEADIIQISTDQIADVEATPGLTIKNLEKTTMTGLFVQGAWEDRGEATQNVNIRKAMDMAINRPEIVKDFFNGYAIPEKYWKVSPIGENWDDTWEATAYDPDKAKALLQEAGYPNAFQKPVIRLYTFAGDWRSKLAELIASYWMTVGLQVDIRQVDETSLMQFMRGTGGMTDDAYGAVGLWSSPVGMLDGISSQIIWYRTDGTISLIRNDPSMDVLFDQALASFDVNERKRIDNQILQKVDDELKYSFGVAYVDSLWGVSEKVGTWLADYANNRGTFSASYFKTIKSK
jgi:peptide/nickel transport system substrate-binding protein